MEEILAEIISMGIRGIEQPEIINIDRELRLRKYTDDCAFALEWYQDEETLMLVDGVNAPYDMDRLYRMYHYLGERGEVYFIEFKSADGLEYRPIGDVSFWQNDMPIVIGYKSLRGQGIGRRVIKSLINRAGQLGFPYLEVDEIYDFNTASQRLFESLGFKAVQKTEKGQKYRLELNNSQQTL